MIGRRAGRALAAVGLASGLAACATAGPEYAPIGVKTGLVASPYGYSDSPNAEGDHLIRVVAPTGDLAHAWWDRRAQTLCAGDRVEKTIYSARRPTVTYESYGGRPGDFHLEGLAACVTPEGAAPYSAPAADGAAG